MIKLLNALIIITVLISFTACARLTVTVKDGSSATYTSVFRDLKDVNAKLGTASLKIGSAAVSNKIPKIGDVISVIKTIKLSQ